MAEVGPSYIAHAEEQIQEPDNLEHCLEENLGENLEQHLEHGLEQSLEQNSVQIVLQNLAQDLEQNLEQDLGHSLDQNVEQSADQDLQQNPQQDAEPQQKGEHGDDTVVEGTEQKWPGWPGENVFRMLVPAQKVGSIIGRKGEFIKKIIEETRARIKILDGPPGTAERAVMVSAKEEPSSSLPPAIDGLLRVHKRVVDGLDSDGSSAAPAPGTKVSTRLLVPASQAGSLIGKQGATVKCIQETSTCIVRVLAAEDVPVFALQEDRVVEVVGDPIGVHKAVELIASHLRKFLVDRSIIPQFEMHMQMTNQRMDHLPSRGPPHQSWGPSQGVPPHSYGVPGFAHNPQYMPPPRQHDNYYPPDMPLTMEKQPHQGISAYGREASMSVPSAAQTAPSMVTQVTKQMQIPLSYADAVIGTAGATISYIRRVSGATVTIQESRGAPGEMTVEISGAGSQVQVAEQLVQNFMAEAGAPAQPQTGADQGYNPYAAHGSVYASPASNPGHAGRYNVYGSNYGY